jgi:hypothetical protein
MAVTQDQIKIDPYQSTVPTVPLTHMVRYWLKNVYSKTFIGNLFCKLYLRYGEWTAKQVRAYRPVRFAVKPIFDHFLMESQTI